MSKILFCSDLHINHSAIIEYSKRPFKDVDEMNEALISNWNKEVSKDDIVFFLGDFAMGNRKLIPTILSRLNGTMILLQGNHDHKNSLQYFPIHFTKLILHLPIIAKRKKFTIIKQVNDFFRQMFNGQDSIEEEVEEIIAEGKYFNIFLCHSPYASYARESKCHANFHGHVHEKFFIKQPSETIPTYIEERGDAGFTTNKLLVNVGVDNGLKRFAPIELFELLDIVLPENQIDKEHSPDSIYVEVVDESSKGFGKIYQLSDFVEKAGVFFEW